MKMMVGASLTAKLKSARQYFSDSPNHMLIMLDTFTHKKFAPTSVATAWTAAIMDGEE
jgi:hypothetical protein